MTTILKIEPDKYDYYEDIALYRVDKKTHKTEYICDDETEWKPTEEDIEKKYNSLYINDVSKLEFPEDMEMMLKDFFVSDVKLELV